MAADTTIETDPAVIAAESTLKGKKTKQSNLHSAWLTAKNWMEAAQRRHTVHLDDQIARGMTGEPVDLAPEALRHELAASADLTAALSGALRRLDADLNKAVDAVYEARQDARMRHAQAAGAKATAAKAPAVQVAAEARHVAFRERMLSASRDTAA